ncbi:hypothetical protein [Citrobacter freundii]|uniref:hypothetical protein n=1 Tax=Citrobacter freundii TaxID=546 RepID=UPI0039796F21
MHIQQFNNLKKIAAQFSSDYQLSSELYDRHVELIEAVAGCEMEESFKRELTGVIARLDLADQIDSKRNAA